MIKKDNLLSKFIEDLVEMDFVIFLNIVFFLSVLKDLIIMDIVIFLNIMSFVSFERFNRK